MSRSHSGCRIHRIHDLCVIRISTLRIDSLTTPEAKGYLNGGAQGSISGDCAGHHRCERFQSPHMRPRACTLSFNTQHMHLFTCALLGYHERTQGPYSFYVSTLSIYLCPIPFVSLLCCSMDDVGTVGQSDDGT
jgi:hypothetical protein